MLGREGMMVIEIWSSDDDAEGERMGKTGKKGPIKKERKSGMKGVKDMEELDCVILDFNPFDTAYLSKKLSVDEPDQDLSVIAERGQVACRDYPHPRQHCVKFSFSRTPHESYCEQCYCYVCDIKAPCKDWKGSEPEHCHASENDREWKNLRREARGQLSRGDSVEYEIPRNEVAVAIEFVRPRANPVSAIPHNGGGEDQDRSSYQNSKYDRDGSCRYNRTSSAQGRGRLTEQWKGSAIIRATDS
ncbi:RPM1 interacting protein 13-like [Aristolochia californica]|uniref:RPM1 interacting protein 13-like n=1 Tax=Aristolochia californica TaxID=171875 RepID=UPI0035D6BDAD